MAGSEMVPAPSALLSLLALKRLDKERHSHIDDFNILPKKSFATDYSYRTGRDQQQVPLQGWVRAPAPVMVPDASGFSLDFHTIPSPTAVSRRASIGTSPCLATITTGS
jgi:hypothetical protein